MIRGFEHFLRPVLFGLLFSVGATIPPAYAQNLQTVVSEFVALFESSPIIRRVFTESSQGRRLVQTFTKTSTASADSALAQEITREQLMTLLSRLQRSEILSLRERLQGVARLAETEGLEVASSRLLEFSAPKNFLGRRRLELSSTSLTAEDVRLFAETERVSALELKRMAYGDSRWHRRWATRKDYLDEIENFESRSAEFNELVALGAGTYEESTEILHILCKTLIYPFKLTEYELTLLSKSPAAFQSFKAATAVRNIIANLVEGPNSVLRVMGEVWIRNPIVLNVAGAGAGLDPLPKTLAKTYRLMQSMINPAMDYFMLFPGLGGAVRGGIAKVAETAIPKLRVLRQPTAPIFEKQRRYFLKNKKLYAPTAEELATLKKFEAYEGFVLQERFLAGNPTFTEFTEYLSYVRGVARGAGVMLAGNMFLHESREGVISVEEYLNNPERYAPKAGQIQLIFESVPYPHVAIRMANSQKVYSYGQSHFSITPLSVYLAAREKVGFQPRSVHIITLNLASDPAKAIELEKEMRMDLEKHAAFQYANNTGINDCMTMLARQFQKHTDIQWGGFWSRLIDASPGQVAMELAAEKTLAQSTGVGPGARVGGIYLVAIEEPDREVWHLTRNAYINALESQLFVSFFETNQLLRAYFDLTHDESNLKWTDPAYQKVLDQAQAETWQTYLDRFEMKNLWTKVNRWGPQDESRDPGVLTRKKEIQELIEITFEEWLTGKSGVSRLLEVEDQSMIDILRWQFVEAALEREKARLHTALYPKK